MVESWVYHSFDSSTEPGARKRVSTQRTLCDCTGPSRRPPRSRFSYYYGDRDYERASCRIRHRQTRSANESQAYLGIGAIQRRQGKWAESKMRIWKKAATLDPKNTNVLVNFVLVTSPSEFRNRRQPSGSFHRGGAASVSANVHERIHGVLWKGILARPKKYFLQPDLKTIRRADYLGRAWILTLERKFPGGSTSTGTISRMKTMFTTTTAPARKFPQGLIHLLQGDKTKHSAEWSYARLISEKLLAKLPKTLPDMPSMVYPGDAGPKARSHCRGEGQARCELLKNLNPGTPGWDRNVNRENLCLDRANSTRHFG